MEDDQNQINEEDDSLEEEDLGLEITSVQKS